MKWNRVVLPVVGLVAVILFGTLFYIKGHLDDTSRLGPGSRSTQKAPEFSLEDLEGKTVSLQDFNDKVVVVDFWATWCGPCREEIPHLNRLYSENKGKGFVVLGISMDSEGKDEIRDFVRKFRMEYPVVMGDDSVADKFGGIMGLPTKFVIDRKGNIVTKLVGYQVQELESAVRTLVGQATPISYQDNSETSTTAKSRSSRSLITSVGALRAVCINDL